MLPSVEKTELIARLRKQIKESPETLDIKEYARAIDFMREERVSAADNSEKKRAAKAPVSVADILKGW